MILFILLYDVLPKLLSIQLATAVHYLTGVIQIFLKGTKIRMVNNDY